MSNQEQHKTVIADKTGNVSIEGNLTIQGETAGVGGSGAFSESEMTRLLSVVQVASDGSPGASAPPIEWQADSVSLSHPEGNTSTSATDLLAYVKSTTRHYRNFTIGGTFNYDLTANGTSSYDINGSDHSFTGSNNPEITCYHGDTLRFQNQSGGHPFQIALSGTVVSQENTEGLTEFTPLETGTYTYECLSHSGSMNGTIEVLAGGSQLFEIVSFVRQAGETHNGVSLSETLYPDRYAIKFIEGSEPDYESSSGPAHCRVTVTDLLGNKATTVFVFTIANDSSDDAPDWHHSNEPGEAYTIFEVPEGSFQTTDVNPHDWTLAPSTEVPTTLAASRAGNSRTDPSTQPSYQLVAGEGDDDNDSVELLPASAGADENRIVFKNAIDADDGAQTIYKIRVRATNYATLGAGGTPQYSEQQIRIRVTNSTFDDSPVLSAGHLLTTIDEGNDTSNTAQNSLAGILNLRNHIDGVNINESGDLINFTKNYNGSNYTFSIANGTGGKLGTSTNASSFASTYFSVINGPLQRQAWLTLTGSHGDGADFEYYSSADHFGLASTTYTNTIYIKIVATNPAGGSPVSKIVGVRIKNNTADDKPTWTGGGATGGTASSLLPFQLAEGVDLNLVLNDLISSSQKATTNTFTIDGSYNDGNKFTISNGALKFITTPDFENPTDQGGVGQDNLYLVKVTATNSHILGQGGSQQQSSQVLYIQVTDDATDNVPQWPESWDPGLLTVSELGPVNTQIYNIPLGVNTDAYTITENATVGSLANAFNIENNTRIRTHATTVLDLTNEQDSIFTIKIASVNKSSGNPATYIYGESKTFTIKVANVLSDEFDMNNAFEFTVQP